MHMHKERLFTKNFLVVFTIDFLLALVYFTLMVTVAQYAVDEFHATTSQAGLVTGIFVLGITVGRFVVGSIIDNFGHKKILFIGIIFYIVATLLYFSINNLPFLLFLRFLHGISLGFTSTATATLVAKILPENRRGEGIGIYSLALIISNAIGPFLGLFLINNASFNVMFICCLIFGFISLFLSFFLSVPPQQVAKEKNTGIKEGNVSKFIDLNVLPISIMILIVGFAYSTIPAFISFFANELQLMDVAGFFFIVYAVVIILSRPIMGRLFDRRGANLVIYPSLLIFAIGMFLLSQVNVTWTFLLAGVLLGFGYGNFLSTGQTLAVKLTPPNRIGIATSTYLIFLNLGFGLGPYLAGFLIPYTGYRGLFITLGCIILACLILYYFIYGKKEITKGAVTTISFDKNGM
ncbi:MFS transporter [Neobacillus niacini]|uniref:MFS transporter n=1 Tax=Neobacillus niacini TaxID=86668 RepID=UPI002FFD7504